MCKFKVLLDSAQYTDKRAAISDISRISNRIVDCQIETSISDIAERVGIRGQTVCPAVFRSGRRSIGTFEEMQLFGIDFDSGIPFETIKQRCRELDLPIAFAYHTLSSSEEHPKFRIFLVHIVPIKEVKLADAVLKMLKVLFPEADKSCFEVSRMFLGGKGLLEQNRVPKYFRFDELAEHFQAQLYYQDRYNYRRQLNSFAERFDIGIDNEHLAISTGGCDTNQNDEKRGKDMKYILELPKISSKIICYQFQKEKSKDIVLHSSVQKDSKIEKCSEDKLCRRCLLCRDFFGGKQLHHAEKFLLLTNLRHFKGYKKKFLKIIETYYSYEDFVKWNYQWGKVDEYQYQPKQCTKEDCPYFFKCNPDLNICLTIKGRRRIERLREPQYIDIDESYKSMQEALRSAMRGRDADIHLIIGQTGIGKTHAYIEILKEIKTPVMIAVPTVKLKNEIVREFQGMVSECVSLEDLLLPQETLEEVKELYNRGLHKEARRVIKMFAEKQAVEYQKSQCEKYLSSTEIIRKKEKSIVMTHGRLLDMRSEDLTGYTIIADEDILLTIMKRTDAVSISDVEEALRAGFISGEKRKEFSKILAAKEDFYMVSNSIDYFSYIEKDKLDERDISGNVNGLLQAGAYHKTSGCIEFFTPKSLPKQKIIVLSATLNRSLYEVYFKNRKVHYYDTPTAKYRGKLLQYSYYSLSRSNMEELSQNGWGKERLLEKIISMTSDTKYAISFKELDNLLGRKLPMQGMHFGNSIGVNRYTGLNGMIIGTPHLNESSYKLIGCYLGADVNGQAGEIHRQAVEYHGYRFNLMSYDDEILQKIQLCMISSELEQSIGRSRLLRTDAVVYVFSNFPCMQAELHQEDYLKEEDKTPLQ